MTPLDRAIIERKLGVMVESLKALEPAERMTLEEYETNLYMRKATERLLQELIESAIDINIHIVVNIKGTAPDDSYRSFIMLGELGVIPAELSKKLAPSAGLRNIIVHEYDTIDNSLILSAVKKARTLYRDYIRAIEEYIGEVE